MTCEEFRNGADPIPTDRAWHDHRVTCESCLLWLEERNTAGFWFAEQAMNGILSFLDKE